MTRILLTPALASLTATLTGDDADRHVFRPDLAQDEFVELVFKEPGICTAVKHVFADMERGARGLIHVTA